MLSPPCSPPLTNIHDLSQGQGGMVIHSRLISESAFSGGADDSGACRRLLDTPF